MAAATHMAATSHMTAAKAACMAAAQSTAASGRSIAACPAAISAWCTNSAAAIATAVTWAGSNSAVCPSARIAATIAVSATIPVSATAVPAAVIPRPCADEHSAYKPIRSVVTVWGASIRCIGVVAPIADRSSVHHRNGDNRGADTNISSIHRILSHCRYRKRHSQQHCKQNQAKFPHDILLVLTCTALSRFRRTGDPETASVLSTAGSWASLPNRLLYSQTAFRRFSCGSFQERFVQLRERPFHRPSCPAKRPFKAKSTSTSNQPAQALNWTAQPYSAPCSSSPFRWLHWPGTWGRIRSWPSRRAAPPHPASPSAGRDFPSGCR